MKNKVINALRIARPLPTQNGPVLPRLVDGPPKSVSSVSHISLTKAVPHTVDDYGEGYASAKLVSIENRSRGNDDVHQVPANAPTFPIAAATP